MWLIIDKEMQRVFAIESVRPPEGAYKPEVFGIKEWDGAVPKLAMADQLADLDPTLGDPDYQDFLQCRLDFKDLTEQADAEIDWLDDVIPQIDGMTIEEVRSVVRRLAQENLRQLKAWRYVMRKLS